MARQRQYCWTFYKGESILNLRGRPKGLTLLEVMIAMFIFLVGIVGVLAAMPTGINSALWVIFQDSAINLSHSKFAEFRRDRADPGGGPQPNLTATAGGYLPASGVYTPGFQEPPNTSPMEADNIQWRDFAHNPGEPYQYYDNISGYEWKVVVTDMDNGVPPVTDPQPPAGYLYPVNSGAASPIGLKKVSVVIRMKSTTRQMKFSQLMFAWGQL
jgi:prepilin-type N-terminal cleavage/methylation domain-containing protein